jgi:serine/threonine protein kinase
LDLSIVLKIITPERANDLTAVNMFLDEARLAASLNHQNVAQVFEVGEDTGIHYLAMEYVHGQDLRAVLAKAGSQGTRIPLELSLTVVAGAAAGLHHAHERRGQDGTPLGIVHRDVSPSNIMIGYDGAVKLLDFGIAKATARSVETQSGIIKGKFAYMAPEQCRGREVDRRSDVFSLGIILYEISTQHRCFRADSDFDTMHRIVTGDVVRPTRLVQGYPQALEAIVMKALAVDSTQRYQSAGLLLEALESFAVSARMSLSTMGLGRFMRDMFGEVQEPWLNTAATKVLQPIAAKESTISRTDGKGTESQPMIERMRDSSGIPDDEAAFPDSGKAEAAKTILDLPGDPRERHQREPHDDVQQGWNAKSYPTSQPSLASNDTLPPDALRPGFVPGAPVTLPPEMNPMTDSGAHSASHSGPSTVVDIDPLPHGPVGTLPPPMPGGPPSSGQHQVAAPLGNQFATPGSQSGPAIPALGVSTKHGYASAAMGRGDVSYPSYQPPPDAMAMAPELQLTPNRRPLFIGLAIVAVGLIVILIVSLSGGSDEPAAKTEPPPDESVEQKTPETTQPEIKPDEDVVDENMVTVVIHSDPKGADVMIAGTKIGSTPFDSKLKRGTKIAQLTVQKEGYAPFNTKIDLGGDYENRNIKLIKLEDLPKGSDASTHDKPDGAKTDTKTDSTKSGTKTDTKSDTKTDSTKTGTKTDTKTDSTKTGTKTDTKTDSTKTGTKTDTKSDSTKTGTKTETKKDDKKKEPACQPRDKVDPFSDLPICK